MGNEPLRCGDDLVKNESEVLCSLPCVVSELVLDMKLFLPLLLAQFTSHLKKRKKGAIVYNFVSLGFLVFKET